MTLTELTKAQQRENLRRWITNALGEQFRNEQFRNEMVNPLIQAQMINEANQLAHPHQEVVSVIGGGFIPYIDVVFKSDLEYELLDELPDLPWVQGSRVHPWLWTGVVEVLPSKEDPPRAIRIVQEGKTSEAVVEGLKRYYKNRYSNVGRAYILAPTEEPKTFKNREEVLKAALIVPVTLYTIDCPICGVDVVQEQTEFSAIDDPYDELHDHLDQYHPEIKGDDE